MSWPSENAQLTNLDAESDQHNHQQQPQPSFEFWQIPPPHQQPHYQQQPQEQHQQQFLQPPDMSEFQRQFALHAYRFQQQQQQEYQQQQLHHYQQQQQQLAQSVLTQPNGVSSPVGLPPAADSTTSPMPADAAVQRSSLTPDGHYINQTPHVGDMSNVLESNRYTSTPLSTVGHPPGGGGVGFPSFAPDMSMIQHYQYDVLSSQLAGAQNSTTMTAGDSGTSTLSNTNTTMNSGNDSGDVKEPLLGAVRNNSRSPSKRDADGLEVLRSHANKEFRTVDGRLSVLSGTRKHSVSIGEIYRRVYGPEGLNMSLIVGILRMAKNKNISEKMRAELARYKIDLMPGRRKNVPTTTFTALCEEEAIQLAVDLFGLARSCYKPNLMGKRMRKSMDLKAVAALATYRKSMDKLNKLIERGDKQAFEIRPPMADDESPMSTATAGIVRLSHLTHGFGNKAISNSLNVTQEFLRCSVECIKDEIQMQSCHSGDVPAFMEVLMENDQITCDMIASLGPKRDENPPINPYNEG